MDNYVWVWYAALLRSAQGWWRQLPVPWWSTAVSQMETTNKMQPRYTKELNVRGLKKMFLEIYSPCINKTCWWSALHKPHREEYLFCIVWYYVSISQTGESKLYLLEGQMVFHYIITSTALMGRRLGWVSVGQRGGLVSWVGFHVCGQVNHILSDMNMGSKVSMVLPVLSRLTLWRRHIGQRRICLCIHEGMSDFLFCWKNGGRLCIVKYQTSAWKPPPFGLCCCSQTSV